MNIAVFSIVMGYCGLAFSYMAASVLWGLPASIGEGIGIVAAVAAVAYAVYRYLTPDYLEDFDDDFDDDFEDEDLDKEEPEKEASEEKKED